MGETIVDKKELMTLENKVRNQFIEKFNSTPELIVRAPGRINLLGEHTDYNGGLVLPGAIDKSIYFALSRSTLSESEIFAIDLNSFDRFDINNLQKSKLKWQNYILGVVKSLQDYSVELGPFHAAFCSNIPQGSGMSSSAALTCGLASGLNALFNGGLSKTEIAKVGQKAETDFDWFQMIGDNPFHLRLIDGTHQD